ncbi:MAG: orotidine-5'-phosphate decarboxylase [Candidatus Gastranaerophilales bacterium]|nr:orotidine-5'-phosphate decarboxylase [Candidatus Gastranaerophilales bacterium]
MLKDKIVLALDVETMDEVKMLVDKLAPYSGIFKVGLQLFCGFGLEIVRYIQSKNAGFFLDVKLHDIPNTVRKASENIVLNGASFFNVHTTGGLQMMKAARQGADDAADKISAKRPVILGVTMLTSIAQNVFDDEFKINKNVSDFALELAYLAKEAGLDGVVASAVEVERIKRELGADFKVLCPGIRPKYALINDQKRVATPSEALNRGADYIVLGRAVTKADDPTDAMKKIYEEIRENEKCIQH